MAAPRELTDGAEWIKQDLNAAILDHDSEFDVVVAAEVIEHLENPRFMVRELYRLLRPGGTAIVSTPNNESWRSILALLGRGHFVAFTENCYPAHITALLRMDITRIFLEAKFQSPRFYFTDYGGIPKSPSVTWQRVSLGLLRGLRFSDNLIAMARKPAES
jgi:2-polyprenyl-3-methyl-5-hydroxy-6-metoxy-1,4-benzoquinol methylase